MKKALSILSVSALLLIGGLLIDPGFVFANGSVSGSTPQSVPEPVSLILLGAGLAGIAIWKRKSD